MQDRFDLKTYLGFLRVILGLCLIGHAGGKIWEVQSLGISVLEGITSGDTTLLFFIGLAMLEFAVGLALVLDSNPRFAAIFGAFILVINSVFLASGSATFIAHWANIGILVAYCVMHDRIAQGDDVDPYNRQALAK